MLVIHILKDVQNLSGITISQIYEIYYVIKKYVQCKNNQCRKLRHEFQEAQKIFDQNYRKTERSYRKNTIIEIENFSSSNPNNFRDSIKKLGPRKTKDIPMEVYDNDNNIVTDLPNVLNKWKSEFETLYNFCPEPGNFDDKFDSECTSNLDNENEDYFRELDNDITIDEVRKAINQTHNNKSVGLDNLPYLKKMVLMKYSHCYLIRYMILVKSQVFGI